MNAFSCGSAYLQHHRSKTGHEDDEKHRSVSKEGPGLEINAPVSTAKRFSMAVYRGMQGYCSRIEIGHRTDYAYPHMFRNMMGDGAKT